MSAKFLLDTNICIYIRQGRPAVLSRFRSISPDEAALSVISFGELIHGARKSREPEMAATRLRALFTALPVLPLPVNAGEAYGQVRARLESDGNTISSNDLWIAAHALSAGLTLVTNNEREFRRVEGLCIENWATPD